MSKRSVRKNRHRPEVSRFAQTFAERVWLGSLARKVRDGQVTRAEAHALLHEKVPHLLGPEHNHSHTAGDEEVLDINPDDVTFQRDQVVVNDETTETHVHGEHCNHG